jgi:hypothetical protein
MVCCLRTGLSFSSTRLDSSLILSSMFRSYSMMSGVLSFSSSEAILASAASRVDARLVTVMFCVLSSAWREVMLASWVLMKLLLYEEFERLSCAQIAVAAIWRSCSVIRPFARSMRTFVCSICMSISGLHSAGINANLAWSNVEKWSLRAAAYALLLSSSSLTTFLTVDIKGPASCSAIVDCKVSIWESTRVRMRSSRAAVVVMVG